MWPMAQGLNLKLGASWGKASSVVVAPSGIEFFLGVKRCSLPLAGKRRKPSHCDRRSHPSYSQSRRFLPLFAPCWDAVTRTPKHKATHGNRYNGEKYGRFSTAVLGVQQMLSPIENDCTYFMQLFSIDIPSIISDRTSHV